MARSGTRLTKDRASAASGGIPNKVPSSDKPALLDARPTGHRESRRAKRLRETLEDQRLWGAGRYAHQPQCDPGLERAKERGESVEREGNGNSRPAGVYYLQRVVQTDSAAEGGCGPAAR